MRLISARCVVCGSYHSTKSPISTFGLSPVRSISAAFSRRASGPAWSEQRVLGRGTAVYPVTIKNTIKIKDSRSRGSIEKTIIRCGGSYKRVTAPRTQTKAACGELAEGLERPSSELQGQVAIFAPS